MLKSLTINNEPDLSNAPASLSSSISDHIARADDGLISAPYNPLSCLFCNKISSDFEQCLTHMSNSHSFFVPDPNYLIDISSFLSFLNTIISEFHECLYCSTEGPDKWAVWEHMKSKGHCKIDLEDEEAGWRDFYDFDSEGEGDGEEDQAVYEKNEGELKLPSGKRLGHRARARYYRQNHIPLHSRSLSTSVSSTTRAKSSDHRLVSRAGTSTSLIGVPQLQQRALRATEKKILQVETRARHRCESRVEKAGNSQKHFKNDVPGPSNG